MKWAVNMRTKTLTICLSPQEVMRLYVEANFGMLETGKQLGSMWAEGLGDIVESAAAVMFPLAFPAFRDQGVGPYFTVQKVAWDEVCDED